MADSALGNISGVVLGDDLRRPLWRATVTARAEGATAARQTTTDDAGKFSFAMLPPGRYLVSASRPGYVFKVFGAEASGYPGMPLVIDRGATVSDVVISLERGAVIAGHVTDSQGAIVGINVTVMAKRRLNGVLRYAGIGSAITDDQGAYRIYGLPAGRYLVAAAFPRRNGSPGRPADLVPDSSNQPADAAAGESAAPTASAPSGMDRYLAVFCPSAVDPANAEPIELKTGDVRSNADIAFQRALAPRIEGVIETSGVPLKSVQVLAVTDLDNPSLAFGEPSSRTLTTSTGRFSLDGLQPGRYRIFGRSAPTPTTPALWASVPVHVSTGSQRIELQLQPGSTVTGTMVTTDSGANRPAADFSQLAVKLTPLDDASGDRASVPLSARPDTKGRFRFDGVPPATYLVSATKVASLASQTPNPPNQSASAGTNALRVVGVKAASAGVGAMAIRVQANQNVDDLELIGSLHPTELTGRIPDFGATPSRELYVVVFAADPQLWSAGSEWVRPPVRPASDGTFRFAGLAPGEYALAFMSTYDLDEGYGSAQVLSALLSGALKVTLHEGERKRQDLSFQATTAVH